MADIVGAFGVPHTPVFPFFVKRDGPDSEIARFFKALTDEFVALKPDLIVMFDTDHLNTFFLDNLPTFAVGVTDTFKGPNDEPREMPVYDIKSLPDFAAHVRRTGIDAGFDLALVQEFSVDHSVAVPLHFMTPQMQIPVIPIFINGHIPPLPKAQRCFDLGRAVKRAIETWPRPLRRSQAELMAATGTRSPGAAVPTPRMRTVVIGGDSGASGGRPTERVRKGTKT